MEEKIEKNTISPVVVNCIPTEHRDIRVIGLCGKAFSGKSTTSKFIKEIYGEKNVCVVSMATPLKKMVSNLFMLSDEQVYGEKKDEIDETWGVTPRQLLQVIGTELFREELPKRLPNLKLLPYSTIWATIAHNIITSRLKEHKIVVIDDLRFEDECRMLKSFPSLIIHIDRPVLEYIVNHKSERQHLDKYIDATIVNEGSIGQLKQKIREILYPIFGEGYANGYKSPLNSL
jgi:hypothetical protein